MNDGTANSAVASATLSVSASNDAPEVLLSKSNASGIEDTDYVFKAGFSNAITVADPDDATLTLTLSAGEGTLTLATTDGIQVIAGSDGSGSMTITGTAAAINAALEGLRYRGKLNYQGDDVISLQVFDEYLYTDSKTINISLLDDGVIDGTDGNDTLAGTDGADTMAGGAGNDTYTVDHEGDVVNEGAGGGSADKVLTSLGTPINYEALYVIPANVEQLTGTSSTGQGVRDNALSNTIVMADGNDVVIADAGGTDSVDGGEGDDFLYFGNSWSAGDQAHGGAGHDNLGLLGSATIQFADGALSGIEQLSLFGGAAIGAGPFHYVLTLADANLAPGERLLVTAASLGAAETLSLDASLELDARVTVIGGAGDDTVDGGQKGDHLYGNAGNDTLVGHGGHDTIVGGAGADHLEGGDGRDTFLYASASDSSGANFDTLVGFDYRVDRIDLPTAVSGWTGDVQTGALTLATFNEDLAAAVDGVLEAFSAVLFRPDSGDYIGRAFAVIDADGDGLYTGGSDFVFELLDPAVPLAPVTHFFI